MKRMRPESQNSSRFVKEHNKISKGRVVLAAIVIIMFAITMVIPSSVYAATVSDRWFSRDRESSFSDVSSGESTTVTDVEPAEASVGYISKQFAKFMRNLGDGITGMLVTDQADLSLDGVVLGRLASHNSTNRSAAQFELAYRNPWGIVGAYMYVTFRSIAYAAFVIMFLLILFPQAIKGDSRSISETKALIGNTVIMFALLYFFPWIVDWCLYLRDAATSALIKLISNIGMDGSQVGNSLLGYFRMRATGYTKDVANFSSMFTTGGAFDGFAALPNQVNFWNSYANGGWEAAVNSLPKTQVEVIDLGSCFLYVMAACLGIVFLANYLSTAIIQTGLFGLFPLFALLSIKDNRQSLKHFSGVFFINMLIPLIDSFLLMTPSAIAVILCGGHIEDSSVGIFLIQLILLWGIIPARTVILRAFGRAFGIDARANGIIGLASLGLVLGNKAISAGRSLASGKSGSGSSERSGGGSGLSGKEALADAEGGVAIMSTAKMDAQSQLQDVKSILGGDYGKNSTLTASGMGVGRSSGGGFGIGSDNDTSVAKGVAPESSTMGDITGDKDDIHSGSGIGGKGDNELFSAKSDEPGVNSIDAIRAENLEARDKMLEEIDANEDEINRLGGIQGMERNIHDLDAEASDLEGRNRYLQHAIDESQEREKGMDMSNPLNWDASDREIQHQDATRREMEANQSRIEAIRGSEKVGEDGRMTHIGGLINDQMKDLNKAYALQARNNNLHAGVDKATRVEKNLAAASGVAGMSARAFESKAQFNYQRAAESNRAKMATYKNYMSSDFSNVITPEQRAMFAKQQQTKEHWAKAGRVAGVASSVAATAAVGVVAIPMGAAMGTDGIYAGAVAAAGAGSLAGGAVDRVISSGPDIKEQTVRAAKAVESRVVSWGTSTQSTPGGGNAPVNNTSGGVPSGGASVTDFSEVKQFHGKKGYENATNNEINNAKEQVRKATDRADGQFM